MPPPTEGRRCGRRWAQPLLAFAKRQLGLQPLREVPLPHRYQRPGVHDSDRRRDFFRLVFRGLVAKDMIHGLFNQLPGGVFYRAFCW